MKKHLLAAALIAGLAFASNASADTVTLYGVVDAGLAYNSNKRQSDVSGFSGSKHESRLRTMSGRMAGSRFGMTGDESLGNGWDATFRLESGIDTDDGRSQQGGRLFGRQAHVGLASATVGGLYIGRQSNAADAYLDSIDPFDASFGFAGVDTVISHTTRADNMIVYKTPVFAGLSAMAGYSFNVNNGLDGASFKDSGNNRLTTAGVQYTDGPVHLIGLYDYYRAATLDSATAQAAGIGKRNAIRAASVGGAVDLGYMTVSAIVGRTQGGWLNGKDMDGMLMSDNERMSGAKLAPGFSAVSSMVGLRVPVGTGQFLASWQRADPKNSNLTNAQRVMNVYSVGYVEALSRRTKLYAYASYVDHFAFNALTDRAVGVGVQHRF